MRGLRTISEYFGIEKHLLESEGVFDRVIGIDSKLFVDPFLLDNLTFEEFKGAKDILKSRIRKFLKLLSLSETEDDLAFKSAVKTIMSKETKGIGIGYSHDAEDGNSIGPKLAKNIAIIGKKILNLGVNDPEIFELIGLFQDGFGADRLSDFTIETLDTSFLAFTQRVALKLGIQQVKIVEDKQGYKFTIPFIQETGKIVIFLPSLLLRDLPVSQESENIEKVVEINSDLREKLNGLVGDDWKEYIEGKEARKMHVLTKRKYIEDLLVTYRNKTAVPYDISLDILGKIIWRDIGVEFAKKYPLDFLDKEVTTLEQMKVIVRQIIDQFKKLVEHNGLNKLIIKANGKHDEKYAQLIFLAVADTYCLANNLDLSPESKKSNGPVDFKISQGNKRIVVETKLSKNDIKSGVAQIEEYEKGEEAYGIYLIIITGDHGTKIDNFLDIEQEVKNKGGYFPEYYIIDGRLKPTPSNLKLKV